MDLEWPLAKLTGSFQGVRKFHGSDYKQSNTFKIILWGISLNGKGKYCFIKKMLKLQIREYGMKKQWSWHGSSCRRNESDIKRSDFYVFCAIQGWSQLAFCGFIRDVTSLYPYMWKVIHYGFVITSEWPSAWSLHGMSAIFLSQLEKIV